MLKSFPCLLWLILFVAYTWGDAWCEVQGFGSGRKMVVLDADATDAGNTDFHGLLTAESKNCGLRRAMFKKMHCCPLKNFR